MRPKSCAFLTLGRKDLFFLTQMFKSLFLWSLFSFSHCDFFFFFHFLEVLKLIFTLVRENNQFHFILVFLVLGFS